MEVIKEVTGTYTLSQLELFEEMLSDMEHLTGERYKDLERMIQDLQEMKECN